MRITLVFAVLLLASFALGAFFTPLEPVSPRHIIAMEEILLGGKTLRVQIADTDAARTRWLSGIETLEDDEGMWFVFPEDGLHTFWMKDMRFPIDILWLDAEQRIIHIEHQVRPETFPRSFMPNSPARYVLEVRAGWVQEYDIQIGMQATRGKKI